MIAIGEEDADRTTSVKIGQPFIVALDENPTTGYCWEIESRSPVLELLEASFDLPEAAQTGGGGKRIFRFVASEEAHIKLRLKLYRPWEGDSSIINRYVFDLKAEP